MPGYEDFEVADQDSMSRLSIRDEENKDRLLLGSSTEPGLQGTSANLGNQQAFREAKKTLLVPNKIVPSVANDRLELNNSSVTKIDENLEINMNRRSM